MGCMEWKDYAIALHSTTNLTKLVEMEGESGLDHSPGGCRCEMEREHRLHCQIGDCVMCRCDSGITPIKNREECHVPSQYCVCEGLSGRTSLLSHECSKEGISSLQRFMSYFSERLFRRPHRSRSTRWERMSSVIYMITLATFCLSLLPLSDGCSSRSTPKPRPPSPTLRPNITIQTYTCPPEYDAHYCLNGATCFTVKIGESILYNCECAEGYMGQRCEFKDLDGSYLPAKQRAMLEQAGLTSGAAIIVVIVVIVCFYLYVRSRRKLEISQRLSRDETDGNTYMGYENERRPFSSYYYPNLSQTNHLQPHQTQAHLSFQTYQHQQQQLPAHGRRPPEVVEGEDIPPPGHYPESTAGVMFHEKGQPPLI